MYLYRRHACKPVIFWSQFSFKVYLSMDIACIHQNKVCRILFKKVPKTRKSYLVDKWINTVQPPGSQYSTNCMLWYYVTVLT